MYSATRNDVKQFASKIEALAKEVQSKVDNGDDYLSVANELMRNSTTLVFTIGEVYAIEQSGSGKKVKATTVKTGNVNRNYHNVRDNNGRFTRK
jgi:hypothetical protein